MLIDGLVTSGKSAARVSTHDLIELIDEPDERRRKAEEVRVDAVDERHGYCVQRVDDLLAVLLCLEFILTATRMTESCLVLVIVLRDYRFLATN